MAKKTRKKQEKSRASFSNVRDSAVRSTFFVSKTLLSMAMPQTASTITSIKDNSYEITDALRAGRTTIKNQMRKLSPKNIRGTFEQAMSDISGDSYKFDQLADDNFDSYDDLDFGDDTDSFEESETESSDGEFSAGATSSSTRDSRQVAKAIIGGSTATIDSIKQMTMSVSRSQLRSTKALADYLTAQSNFSLNLITAHIAQTNNKLDVINSNLIQIMRFQDKNVGVANQAMLEYFDKSIDLLNQIKSATAMPDKKHRYGGTIDDYLGDNGFDLGGYIEKVKTGWQDSIFGSMFELLGSLKEMGASFGPADLLSILPKNTKRGLSKLDKNLHKYIKEGIYRIGDLQDSDNMFLQFIGEMFGESRKKKSLLNLGNFHKEQMGWNGIAQKTLVEVIPGYLAKIEAKLTGQEERYFDMDKGYFRTASSIRKSHEKDIQDSLNSGMYEVRDLLEDALSRNGVSADRKKDIQRSLNRLFNDRIRNNEARASTQYTSELGDILKGTMSATQYKDLFMGIEDSIQEVFTTLREKTEELEESMYSSHVYRNIVNSEDAGTIRKGYSKTRDRFILPDTDFFKDTFSFGTEQYGTEEYIRSTAAPYLKEGRQFKITKEFMKAYQKAIQNGEDVSKLDRMIRHEAQKQSLSDKFSVGGILAGPGKIIDAARDKFDEQVEKVDSKLFGVTYGREALASIKGNRSSSAKIEDTEDEVVTQTDPKYANIKLGTTSSGKTATMRDSGCGYAGIADTAKLMGKNYTPEDIAKFAQKIGMTSEGAPTVNFFTHGLRQLGMHYIQIDPSKIGEILSSGGTVAVSGAGGGIFSQAGHMVTATGITKHGKVIIRDPLNKAPKKVKLSTLIKYATTAFIVKNPPVGFGPGDRASTGGATSVMISGRTSGSNVPGNIAHLSDNVAKSISMDPTKISEAQLNKNIDSTVRLAEESKDLVPYDGSFLSIVKNSVLTAFSSFGNFIGKLMGKNGFLKRFFENDLVISIKEKLFGDEGVFKDQIGYAKRMINGKGFTKKNGEVVEDTDNSVFRYLKDIGRTGAGYTRQYLFGDSPDDTVVKSKDHAEIQSLKKYKSEISQEELTPEEAERLGYTTEAANGLATASGKYLDDKYVFDILNDQIQNSKYIDYGKKKISNSGDKKLSTGQLDIKYKGITNDGLTAESAAKITLISGMEEAKDKFVTSASKAANNLFGEDEFWDKPKSIFDSFTSFIKTHAPKIITGAGIGAGVGALTALSGPGLLGALFLPGGPIGGAIAGAGISLVSQTETFKNFLFGEKDESGERDGGLINKEHRAQFKKMLPMIVGASVVGAAKGLLFGNSIGGPAGFLMNTLLPGGPIGGAIMGLGAALLFNNKRFKEILFGEKGEDNKRTGGVLSGVMNKASEIIGANKETFKNGLKGLGIGAVTGAALSQMGFIGSALSLGGPIGLGVLGLGVGIASSTETFKRALFGYQDYDEDGNPVGHQHDGILGKARNLIMLNILEPLKQTLNDKMEDFAYWAKDHILYPFREAFGPIIDSFNDIKDNISDFIKDRFDTLADLVTDIVKKGFSALFSPFTKIIGGVLKGATKLTSFAAKLALSPVSGTLNLLKLVTSPQRMAHTTKMTKNFLSATGTQMGNILMGEGSLTDKVKSIGEMLFNTKDRWAAAKQGYIDGMDEAGRNSLGWMNIADERAKMKEERKKLRETRASWARVDKIRQNIGAKENDRGAIWTERHAQSIRKRLKSAFGKDFDFGAGLDTEDAIKQLIYDKDAWKENYLKKKDEAVVDPFGGATADSDEVAATNEVEAAVTEGNTILSDIYDMMKVLAGKEIEARDMKRMEKIGYKQRSRKIRAAKRRGIDVKSLNLDDDFDLDDLFDIPTEEWRKYHASREAKSGDFLAWYDNNNYRWTGTPPPGTSHKPSEAKIPTPSTDDSDKRSLNGFDTKSPSITGKKVTYKNGVVDPFGGEAVIEAIKESGEKTADRLDSLNESVYGSDYDRDKEIGAPMKKPEKAGITGFFSKFFKRKSKDDKKKAKAEKEAQESAEAKSLGKDNPVEAVFGKDAKNEAEKEAKGTSKKSSPLTSFLSKMLGLGAGLLGLIPKAGLGLAALGALSKYVMPTIAPVIEWGFDKLGKFFLGGTDADGTHHDGAIIKFGKFLFGEQGEDGVYKDGILVTGIKSIGNFITNNAPAIINGIRDIGSTLLPIMADAVLEVIKTGKDAIWSLVKEGWNTAKVSIFGGDDTANVQKSTLGETFSQDEFNAFNKKGSTVATIIDEETGIPVQVEISTKNQAIKLDKNGNPSSVQRVGHSKAKSAFMTGLSHIAMSPFAKGVPGLAKLDTNVMSFMLKKNPLAKLFGMPITLPGKGLKLIGDKLNINNLSKIGSIMMDPGGSFAKLTHGYASDSIMKALASKPNLIGDLGGNIASTVIKDVNGNLAKATINASDNIAKSGFKAFTETATKVAKNNTDDVLKIAATNNSKTLKKFLDVVDKGVGAIADNKVIANVAKQFNFPIDKIVSAAKKVFKKISGAIMSKIGDTKLVKKACDLIAKKSAKGAAKTGVGAATLGVGTLIELGIDSVAGALAADQLFKVPSDQVDMTMRMISALMGALLGQLWFIDILLEIYSMFSNHDPKCWVATELYKLLCFGDQDKIDNLSKKQLMLQAETDNYNKAMGTQLTTTEYDALRHKTLLDKGLNFIGLGKKTDYLDQYAVTDEQKAQIEAGTYKAYNPTSQTYDDSLAQFDSVAATFEAGFATQVSGMQSAYQYMADESMKYALDASKTLSEYEKAANVVTDISKPGFWKYRGSSNDNPLSKTLWGFDRIVRAYPQMLLSTAQNASSGYDTIIKQLESVQKNGIPAGTKAPVGFGDALSQNDPRWANMQLGKTASGKSTTMQNGGCGPIALSEVARASGKNVNPMQIASMAKSSGYIVDGGSSSDLFTSGARKLGLQSSAVSPNKIEDYLRQGKQVILSGVGSGNPSVDPYTRAGHIVTASGIDKNGNVIVKDPRYGTTSKYPLSVVKQGSTGAWAFGGARGYGDGDDSSLFGTVGDIFGKLTAVITGVGRAYIGGTGYKRLFDNQGNYLENRTKGVEEAASIPGTIPGSGSNYTRPAITSNITYKESTSDRVNYIFEGSRNDFINFIGNIAVQQYPKYHVLPSLVIAQAGAESGWGKRATGHNLYGITAGKSWKGKTITKSNGLTFKDYDTFEDSVLDYLNLMNADRYKPVLAASTWREATIRVQDCGYCPAPYAKLLQEVISDFKLYEWDKKVNRNSGYGIIDSIKNFFTKPRIPNPNVRVSAGGPTNGPSSSDITYANAMSKTGQNRHVPIGAASNRNVSQTIKKTEDDKRKATIPYKSYAQVVAESNARNGVNYDGTPITTPDSTSEAEFSNIGDNVTFDTGATEPSAIIEDPRAKDNDDDGSLFGQVFSIFSKLGAVATGIGRAYISGKPYERQFDNEGNYLNKSSATINGISSDGSVASGDYDTDDSGRSTTTVSGETPREFFTKNLNARVSAGYGYYTVNGETSFHKGMDFTSSSINGKPIPSPISGIVRIVATYDPNKHHGGWGNYVKVTDGDGYTHLFAHLIRLPSKIKTGDHISRGDIIGNVGSTGWSTGPHLHYQIDDPSGNAIDPDKFTYKEVGSKPKYESYAKAVAESNARNGVGYGEGPYSSYKPISSPLRQAFSATGSTSPTSAFYAEARKTSSEISFTSGSSSPAFNIGNQAIKNSSDSYAVEEILTRDTSSGTEILRNLNVALNTDNIEEKMDAIVSILKLIAEKPSGYGDMNNTNVVDNRKSVVAVPQQQNDDVVDYTGSDLVTLHTRIASGRRRNNLRRQTTI